MGGGKPLDRRYWLLRGNERFGPYTWAHLTWFEQSGLIGGDDLVETVGESGPVPARELLSRLAAGPAQAAEAGPLRAAPAKRPVGALVALVALVVVTIVLVVRDDAPGVLDVGRASDEVDVGVAEVIAPAEAAVIVDVNGAPVAGDQVLVVLRDGADRTVANRVAATVNGEVVGQIELAGLWQISIAPTDLAGLTAIVDTLAANPEVDRAAPNATAAPDDEIRGSRISPMTDPLYSGALGDGFRMIGLESAWQYLAGSGIPTHDVKVGITDSGIYRQGDPRLSEFPEGPGDVNLEFPDPTIDERTAPEMYTDANGNRVCCVSNENGGHGTGTATTFFGDADNGGPFGVASVLGSHLTAVVTNIFPDNVGGGRWFPTPSTQPGDPPPEEWVQVSPGLSYTADNLKAIADQVRKGARVINMSWGCIEPCQQSQAFLYRRFFEQMAHRHPDVLFVASAGNNGHTPTNRWPSGHALPNMITVGNVMNDGSTVASSNRAGSGMEVTLAAPGQQAVRGVEADGTPIADYGGTSNAAPQVSGAAALLLSIKPDLTAEQLKKYLTDSARTTIERPDGTTASIDPGVGGRVLAVDQAVLNLIRDERIRLGLDPPRTLSDTPENAAENAAKDAALAEMLTGSGVLDSVAVSDGAVSRPDPSTWTVTAFVGACAAGCTSVTMEASAGVGFGNSSQQLDAAGQLTWSNVTVTQYPASLTLYRTDNGAGSRIVIPGPGEEPVGPTSTVPPDLELGTGDVQATLIWSGDSDMDLHVIEPNGEEISYTSKLSSTGGALDHDDIPTCGSGAGDHVENIFWPTGEAPPGSYNVFVRFYNACVDGSSQSVQLTVRVNGQVVISQAITLTELADSAMFPFTTT